MELKLLVKYLVRVLATEDHRVPPNKRGLHLANEIVYVLVQLRDKIGVTWFPILQVLHASLVFVNLFLEIGWDAQSEVLFDAELGDVDRGSRIDTLRAQLVHVAYGINEVLLQVCLSEQLAKFLLRVVQVLIVSLEMAITNLEKHGVVAETDQSPDHL